MDGTEPSEEMEKGEASRPPPFLRLRSVNDLITNDLITLDDLIVFCIEHLFKDNKSNNEGNCYGHNDQKQD